MTGRCVQATPTPRPGICLTRNHMGGVIGLSLTSSRASSTRLQTRLWGTLHPGACSSTSPGHSGSGTDPVVQARQRPRSRGRWDLSPVIRHEHTAHAAKRSGRHAGRGRGPADGSTRRFHVITTVHALAQSVRRIAISARRGIASQCVDGHTANRPDALRRNGSARHGEQRAEIWLRYSGSALGSERSFT